MYTTWFWGPVTCIRSTATPLDAVTERAGSVTTSPSTITRPSAISRSAARREATPAWARNFARRIGNYPRSAMDLELLERTIDGPAYRAGQVWAWAARGAAGYEEM